MKPDEERPKLTAEDLFGDILADLEGPKAAEAPAIAEAPKAAEVPKVVEPPVVKELPKAAATPKLPEPTAPKALPSPLTVVAPPTRLPVQAPSAPHVMLPPKPSPPPLAVPRPSAPKIAQPAPKTALPSVGMPKITAPTASARELFKDVLEPLQDMNLSGKKLQPKPAVTASPRPVAPKRAPDEFTLSGISGVKDPFEMETIQTDPAIAKGSGPIAAPAVVPASTFPPPATAAAPPIGSLASMPTPAKPPAAPLSQENGNNLEEFGNYYLLEKIAVGGMAELFKARQQGVANFEKTVAIKRILPHLSDNDEFVRMFIDEAKLAAQLTHPNIAQIFDLGKAGGFYYIAMEYVDGKDLRSLLRKVREFKRPFPEAAAAFVIMKVANALDYAHRKRGMNDKELKLVHRDISPQNILLSVEGAVKLVDFGIAKAATKSTQTMAGALKGKLLYMSPEQARGEQLDSRSDIYSLGLVLFELLTGERCFQADSELGVLEKVRMGKISDVRILNPNVSPEMASILEKSLQKNMDTRYPTARFMERDLKALLVKHANEPTEHDVAEYVNAMLKGSKEQVEHLCETRFQPKHHMPIHPPKEIPGLSGTPLEDKPTRAQAPKHMTVPMPVPPPDLDVLPEENHRKWLTPVIMIIVAAVAVGIWIALR